VRTPKVELGVAEVPVNTITPNPHQPRAALDETMLRELADSIREHGLIQPLIVTQSAGGYQLIAGERRWRAAQLRDWRRFRSSSKRPRLSRCSKWRWWKIFSAPISIRWKKPPHSSSSWTSSV